MKPLSVRQRIALELNRHIKMNAGRRIFSVSFSGSAHGVVICHAGIAEATAKACQIFLTCLPMTS